jgi:hypothetical protein
VLSSEAVLPAVAAAVAAAAEPVPGIASVVGCSGWGAAGEAAVRAGAGVGVGKMFIPQPAASQTTSTPGKQRRKQRFVFRIIWIHYHRY